MGVLNLHPNEAMKLTSLADDDKDKFDYEKFYELMSSEGHL